MVTAETILKPLTSKIEFKYSSKTKTTKKMVFSSDGDSHSLIGLSRQGVLEPLGDFHTKFHFFIIVFSLFVFV